MSLLFPYLIKVSIILALTFSIYALLFRRNTLHQCNRFYLLGSVALSFIAPLIPFELSSSNALYSYTLPALEMNQINTVSEAATFSINLSSLLGLMYFLVAGFFFLRFALSIRALVASWKGLEKVVHDDSFILLAKKDSMAYSFFKQIVLPEDFVQNPEQYDLVLKHEKIHVSQKHSWDIMFLELCKVVLWFNPFAYLLKNELSAQHEFFIDRTLTQNATDLEVYGHLLISQSVGAEGLQLGNAFNNSLTKNRISMMTKTPDKKRSLIKYFFIVPIIVALSFMIACQKSDQYPQRIESVEYWKTTEDVYIAADRHPMFEGGIDAQFRYIHPKLNWSKEAKEAKLIDEVAVKFVVEKDGSISNVEITKDPGYGCGEELKRVISGMPDWEPAKRNGEPVRFRLEYPVRLILG